MIGFLGLDSPTPHAFDALFEATQHDDAGTTESTADVDKPLDEQNLFYGLADATATIIMLTKDDDPSGERVRNDNGESSSH